MPEPFRAAIEFAFQQFATPHPAAPGDRHPAAISAGPGADGASAARDSAQALGWKRRFDTGRHGPPLLEDYILREKIAHFARQRIPERIVQLGARDGPTPYPRTVPIIERQRRSGDRSSQKTSGPSESIRRMPFMPGAWRPLPEYRPLRHQPPSSSQGADSTHLQAAPARGCE